MTTHYLHHGGNTVQNPNWELYPAAKPTGAERLAPAAHKEPIAFGMTRLLDFSQKEMRRQAGLQAWIERITANGTPLVAGDIVTLSAIPANSLLLGFAWGVEQPEEGVAFDLLLSQRNQKIASGVNGASVDSYGGTLPEPIWIKDGDYLAAEFTSFPAKGAKNLRFWVSPIVLVPKIGN